MTLATVTRGGFERVLFMSWQKQAPHFCQRGLIQANKGRTCWPFGALASARWPPGRHSKAEGVMRHISEIHTPKQTA